VLGEIERLAKHSVGIAVAFWLEPTLFGEAPPNPFFNSLLGSHAVYLPAPLWTLGCLITLGCYTKPPEASSSAGPNTVAQAPGDRWLIDSTSRIHDLSPTTIGAPSIGTSPQGNALCFDGDDGIVLAKNPLEGLAAFTLEVHLRIDGVTNPALAEPRFLHIETATGSRATMEARVTATRFYVDTFLLAGGARLTLAVSDKEHAVGRWTWIALTYSEGQMRHFVDGVLDASGSVVIPAMGPGKISLGVRQNLVHYFSGCIRELRVTPRALPAAELQRETP
jgi:hypothetical protein